MYDDIKFTKQMINKEPEKSTPISKQTLKDLAAQHSTKIAKAIGLLLIALIIVVLAATSKANDQEISSKEIQQNSTRHQELQVLINSNNKSIAELRSENGGYIEEQKDLEERNKLLRQVFTMGQNQK